MLKYCWYIYWFFINKIILYILIVEIYCCLQQFFYIGCFFKQFGYKEGILLEFKVLLVFYKFVFFCFLFYVQIDYEEGILLEFEVLLLLYIVVFICVFFFMQIDYEEGDLYLDCDEGWQGVDVCL